MTMMQKVQAKKSKKGFTLVELVIVIAILAILAAIAIPVITTTTYGSANHTAAEATIADICESNNLGQSGTYTVSGANGSSFFNRSIGGTTYKMVYSTGRNVEVSGGGKTVAGTDITSGLAINALEPNT